MWKRCCTVEAATTFLLKLPASNKMLPRAASTNIYHRPKGLGFFTLETDFLRELNARLMWPDLTLYQSFQNQEKWRYSRSILGTSLCFGREFHVTINLSKSQEAQKVESAICIHSKSRHKGNVYISISHFYFSVTHFAMMCACFQFHLTNSPNAVFVRRVIVGFQRMMVMWLEFMHKLLYKKLQGRFKRWNVQT